MRLGKKGVLFFALPEPAAAVDIAALFDNEAAFLVRVVARLAGNGPHVEDIVQEVFLVAHRRRGELRPGPEVRGWLYRVARNLVLHHRRSIARRIRLVDAVEQQGLPAEKTGGDPDDVIQRNEVGWQIRRTLLQLPMKQREVLALYELEGLDGKDIATLLDIPLNTVWTRLHHARAAFKKSWASAASSWSSRPSSTGRSLREVSP